MGCDERYRGNFTNPSLVVTLTCAHIRLGKEWRTTTFATAVCGAARAVTGVRAPWQVASNDVRDGGVWGCGRGGPPCKYQRAPPPGHCRCGEWRWLRERRRGRTRGGADCVGDCEFSLRGQAHGPPCRCRLGAPRTFVRTCGKQAPASSGETGTAADRNFSTQRARVSGIDPVASEGAYNKNSIPYSDPLPCGVRQVRFCAGYAIGSYKPIFYRDKFPDNIREVRALPHHHLLFSVSLSPSTSPPPPCFPTRVPSLDLLALQSR